jgi:hypothetical protein
MDEKKKLCTSCKLILPSEFAYCPMCGEPVIDRGSLSHTPPYEPPLQDENPILLERLSGALGGRKAIIIGLVALVLIVLGVIAVVSLTQSQHSQPIVNPSETATPSPSPSPTVVPTPTPVPTFFPTATPVPTFFPTVTPNPTTPTPSLNGSR